MGLRCLAWPLTQLAQRSAHPVRGQGLLRDSPLPCASVLQVSQACWLHPLPAAVNNTLNRQTRGISFNYISRMSVNA